MRLVAVLRRTGVAALMLAFAVDGSAAQNRVAVAVELTLAEPSYRAELRPEEIERFQREAATLIARSLQEQIAFLSFSAEDSGDYRLRFRLDARDPGEGGALSSINEVGLHATLAGPGIGEQGIYWTVYRPKSAFADPLGTVDDMLRELGLKLSGADYDRLSEELLSRISISQSAELWEEPLGWIIPFQRSDLCVDARSRLEIVNLVSSDVGQTERRYIAEPSTDFDPDGVVPPEIERLRHHLLSEAVADQARLEELRRAVSNRRVVVKGIYVIDYLFSPSACEPIASPDEAFEEGGTT